jgi:tetratricopeptide (TPR) repeat protein
MSLKYVGFSSQHRGQQIVIAPGILLVICLLLSNITTATGQSSIKFAGVDTLIDQAVDYVYQKKYFEAIAMCDQVIRQYPDNPLGYLGAAGVYHIIMLNYRITQFEPKFDSLANQAIVIGEKALQRYANDANAYFALGAAYGFRGLNRIRKGEWFGAFKDGLKGVANMKKAHEMNPELHDVYYGLGLYYYWKSAKARVLTFLRLMKDERQKGIEYLKIAMQKGRLSALEAVFALIEIYYYEDRYEEALAASLSLKEKFDQDLNWNYLTAKIYDKLNRWAEAKEQFTRLLKLLEESEFKAYGFLAECHFGIAKASFELGDYHLARAELDQALTLSKLYDPNKEIEGPLLDFSKVLSKMNELDHQLNHQTRNEWSPAGQ